MIKNQVQTLQPGVENAKAESQSAFGNIFRNPPNLYHQVGGESHLLQDNELEKPPPGEPENLFSRLRRDRWTSIGRTLEKFESEGHG